jgi:hypothetical protein
MRPRGTLDGIVAVKPRGTDFDAVIAPSDRKSSPRWPYSRAGSYSIARSTEMLEFVTSE